MTDRPGASLAPRARQQAAQLGHAYVGTGHLLLALLAEDLEVSALLSRLGATPRQVAGHVERRLPRGVAPPSRGPLPLTARLQRALDLALEEASAIGHDRIVPAHVLLGLVREPDGIAGRALRAAGIHVDAVRRGIEPAAGEGAFPAR